MSLLAYQEMKPSGIEYSGEIPSDWSLKRLGDLVAFAQGKAHEPYIDDDGDYICVNSRFVSTSGKTIKTCSVNLTPASLNDILMVMSDLPNGRALARAYYVDDHGKYAVNQRVCRITAEKAHSRFLFYLLDRHPGLMLNDDGVHQTHLSNSDFQKLKLYLPSLSEQNQIARFLDHETARIDALIEEQQRLIELLKEKRQAVISHAVTKGLDPTVPMKDSGVEWLGEVPAHWESLTLGRVASSVKTGGTPSVDLPSADIIDGVEWYTPGDFTGDLLLDSSEKRVSAGAVRSGDAKVFPSGSVLIVSIGATLGKVGHIRRPASANQQINAVVPGPRVDGYFLAYSLSVKVNAMRFLSNASTIGIMNQEKTKEIWLSLPPLQEQKLITEFLDKQTSVIDKLIQEAAGGVALLQERRSALISAAVTGKIDVRGWQPPASAPTPELVEEAV